MQVRLASWHSCCFVIGSLVYQTNPTQLYTLCKINENETMERMLLRCTIYKPIREHYLADRLSADGGLLGDLISVLGPNGYVHS